RPKKKLKWVENGPQGVSAISVVLEWIEKLGNYQRWKGGGAAGETKEVICTEVNNLLREKGFPCRTNKHVRHKIQDLEKSYRTAVDWKNNTGQGILDAGGAGSEDLIRKEILRRCPFWDTLSPVMGERLTSRPPVTNESDQVVSRTCTTPTPHTVQTHRHPAGQSLPASSRDNRSSTPGSANSVGRIRTDEQSQESSASLTQRVQCLQFCRKLRHLQLCQQQFRQLQLLAVPRWETLNLSHCSLLVVAPWIKTVIHGCHAVEGSVVLMYWTR
ncbi:hypothetical protein DFJ73DRAFT_626640, partial [Zopfochytrium polystomum]